MGRYLHEPKPEPKHHCIETWPHAFEVEEHAVWQCDCGRVYTWNANRGYGFEWVRVIIRKPLMLLGAWIRRNDAE